MEIVLCACGCETPVKEKGAKYAHGHHLRLPQFRVRTKKLPIENTCLHCGKTFISIKHHRHRQSFCSNRCSALWRCQKKGTRWIDLTCRWCGATFQRTKSTMNSIPTAGRYCSRACQQAYWKDERIKNPKPGSYRRNAYELKGIRHCERCGYSRVPEILVVHHKDGNRKNAAIDNLAILCPNCHGEEHFLNDGKVIVPSAHVGTTANQRNANRIVGRTRGNAKLTIPQVLNAVRMAKRGKTPKEISEKFKVTQAAIIAILNGKSWSWLTGIRCEGPPQFRIASSPIT